MSIINNFIQWLNSFLYSQDNNKEQQYVPPVKFDSITIIERPPKNANVKKDTLYLVADTKNNKWTLFRCPCGCSHVITLSLQSIHNPHWKITLNKKGHPTLYPSIWQDTPCFSHFWLKEGRICWCQDSGTPPWQEKNKFNYFK